jgi:hypothetical protein
MSILIICPGCRAQFRVGDQNAGKQGPCPKCKVLITVPKPEEVKIHVPEEFSSGGKTLKGQLVTKPIAREKTKLSPVVAVAIGGGVLVGLIIAWILGDLIAGNLIVSGAATLVVSFPLVLAAYLVLRDDELEPYRGMVLWIRVSICSVIYAALWAGFIFVPDDFRAQGMYWLFIAPPFVLLGTATAWAALDLSPENAALHYTFYVLMTLLLRWLTGMPAVWSAATG